jgi:transposase
MLCSQKSPQQYLDILSTLVYDLTMSSLTKKLIKGRPYYYLRECRRVNGKPKIVWQEYIGTPQQLALRLTSPKPQEIIVREFGASAASFDIAQQLEIVSFIDRHVPKEGNQGPSVGEYLLVACLNRCVAPCSKAKTGEWYDKTILPRLLGIKSSQLSSQRFWDNMNRIDQLQVSKIEQEISAAAVSRFGLDLRCLLFDATNFFTFVDSFNDRAKLPQRGHGKEGRDNLRIIGLALMVTSDGDVPLFHNTYAGNQHDSVTFSSVAGELADRCRKLSEGVCDITLVFDKGNNSKENLDAVDAGPYHFVGSLVPSQHPQLLRITRNKMRRLDKKLLPAVWSYRTEKEIFGIRRTVLVTFNRELYRAQAKTLKRETTKRRRKFQQLQTSLQRHIDQVARGKKPTLQGIRNRVQGIVAGRHMKQLFLAKVTMGKDEIPRLRWAFNDREWVRLDRTLLGKTILFTDREEWTDEQIVMAYRSQSHVEAAFRRMKDPRFLTFRPTHHWTDQKLRVHAFYCVLALMITSLLCRKLAQAGIYMSIARMMERLNDINEVVNLYATPKGAEPRMHIGLSQRDAEQTAMLKALDLERYISN